MLRTLRDGTRLLIRPIQPDDKARLAAGMEQLSRESIRRRFLVAKPALSSAELRYLTEVDGHHHIALVAVLEDEPDEIAAVARCVRLVPGGEDAEFAIVVGDRVQRRGIGRLLAVALADVAQAEGIRRFTATTLSDNVAVQRLMASFAVRVQERAGEGAVRELVAHLPAPREPARA